MSDHIQHLKEAGVFRGKIVALMSCYEKGVEGFQSYLTAGANGAAAIVYYPTAINASAVESVMRELSTLLGPEASGPTPYRLDTLLEQSADRALERADTPSEKRAIEGLRHPLILLSRSLLLAETSDINS